VLTTKACERRHHQWCGPPGSATSRCYNDRRQNCCHDNTTGEYRVQPRRHGDKCCGTRNYFDWLQTCCDGALVDEPGLSCCGREGYDPSRQGCTGGRTVSRKPTGTHALRTHCPACPGRLKPRRIRRLFCQKALGTNLSPQRALSKHHCLLGCSVFSQINFCFVYTSELLSHYRKTRCQLKNRVVFGLKRNGMLNWSPVSQTISRSCNRVILYMA